MEVIFQPGALITYCVTLTWWLRGRYHAVRQRLRCARCLNACGRRAISAASGNDRSHDVGAEPAVLSAPSVVSLK